MSGKREAMKGKQRKDQGQTDGQSRRGENGYKHHISKNYYLRPGRPVHPTHLTPRT